MIKNIKFKGSKKFATFSLFNFLKEYLKGFLNEHQTKYFSSSKVSKIIKFFTSTLLSILVISTSFNCTAWNFDEHLNGSDSSYSTAAAGSNTTQFITTWTTSNTGTVVTAVNQVKLPLANVGTYNFTVDWGDIPSAVDVITAFNQAEVTHTYAAGPGTYTITITGQIEGFGFAAAGEDNSKITDVNNWGQVRLHNNGGQFRQCNNLANFSATDTPNLSNVTIMASMFNGATLFNGGIASWNVSSVTNMLSMFQSANSFNQNISNWNVSSVTNMNAMFSSASTFNQPLNSWNVSSVTGMSSMFINAVQFNQDLSSWNVSSVTNMANMFNGASVFNMNISAWITSAVTDMSGMFKNATTFNQNISAWCVTNITAKPLSFDLASGFLGNAVWQPQWGTCL